MNAVIMHSAASDEIPSAAFAQAVRTQKRRAYIAPRTFRSTAPRASVGSAVGVGTSLKIELELSVFLVCRIHAARSINVIECIVYPSSAQKDNCLEIMPLGVSAAYIHGIKIKLRLGVSALIYHTAYLRIA